MTRTRRGLAAIPAVMRCAAASALAVTALTLSDHAHAQNLDAPIALHVVALPDTVADQIVRNDPATRDGALRAIADAVGLEAATDLTGVPEPSLVALAADRPDAALTIFREAIADGASAASMIELAAAAHHSVGGDDALDVVLAAAIAAAVEASPAQGAAFIRLAILADPNAAELVLAAAIAVARTDAPEVYLIAAAEALREIAPDAPNRLGPLVGAAVFADPSRAGPLVRAAVRHEPDAARDIVAYALSASPLSSVEIVTAASEGAPDMAGEIAAEALLTGAFVGASAPAELIVDGAVRGGEAGQLERGSNPRDDIGALVARSVAPHTPTEQHPALADAIAAATATPADDIENSYFDPSFLIAFADRRLGDPLEIGDIPVNPGRDDVETAAVAPDAADPGADIGGDPVGDPGVVSPN